MRFQLHTMICMNQRKIFNTVITGDRVGDHQFLFTLLLDLDKEVEEKGLDSFLLKKPSRPQLERSPSEQPGSSHFRSVSVRRIQGPDGVIALIYNYTLLALSLKGSYVLSP